MVPRWSILAGMIKCHNVLGDASYRPGRVGLTLAETLVSLCLLSLLMVAVLNLFPTTMMVVRGTRTGWLARLAAQNEIERLAAIPFADLHVGTVKDEDVTLSDGAKIHLRSAVAEVEGHYTNTPDHRPLLKRITCDVSWQGRAVTRTAHQELDVHSLRR